MNAFEFEICAQKIDFLIVLFKNITFDNFKIL